VEQSTAGPFGCILEGMDTQFYCSVCFMMGELIFGNPIRVNAVMMIDGQSVCEDHSRSVLANVGAPLSGVVRNLERGRKK
jgi:hypothetical protein